MTTSAGDPPDPPRASPVGHAAAVSVVGEATITRRGAAAIGPGTRPSTSAGSAGSHLRSLKLLWPAVRSRQVVGTSATRRRASVALTVSSSASSNPAVLSIVDRVEEAARVELEVVRRVVGRDAGEPVERQAGGPAQQPLERRPADLVAAAHVAGRGDDVGAVAREGDHRVDDARLVGPVGHRDQDVRGARAGDPGLHRVQDAAAEVVAETAEPGSSGARRSTTGTVVSSSKS